MGIWKKVYHEILPYLYFPGPLVDFCIAASWFAQHHPWSPGARTCWQELADTCKPYSDLKSTYVYIYGCGQVANITYVYACMNYSVSQVIPTYVFLLMLACQPVCNLSLWQWTPFSKNQLIMGPDAHLSLQLALALPPMTCSWPDFSLLSILMRGLGHVVLMTVPSPVPLHYRLLKLQFLRLYFFIWAICWP